MDFFRVLPSLTEFFLDLLTIYMFLMVSTMLNIFCRAWPIAKLNFT